MTRIKQKGLYYVLQLVASLLALVTLILGATQQAMTTNQNFSTGLMVALAVGIVLVVANLFVDLDFWPLLPSVSFFLGLGMIVNEGLPVVVDKINNISFQGGNFEMVAAYLVMMLVASVLSIIACFVKER
jgi:hypothetical protein